MSNVRFVIMDAPDGFKIICAYGQEEIVWRGFKRLSEAGQRIAIACKNLEKMNHREDRTTDA